MSTSALEFVPTQGELSVVAAILEYARVNSSPSSNLDDNSQLDSQTAVDILQRSGLSNVELSSIWTIADEDQDGNLSERELAIAVRLIGWAQSGKPVNRSFLNYSDGPLPTLKDVWENKWSSTPVELPPINLHDKIEFHRAFREACPVNGLLDGEKVRDIFLKTNLSFSQLDQVWNLIDTQGRGSLNNVEFAVGLYLIQAIKTCQLTVLPSSIPPHIYDQLSVKSNSPFATPRSPTKSAPLPWKSPSISVKNVATQFDQPKAEPPWDVSTLEQAEADRHFDTLDTEKSGFVDGDESARFMLKFFRLPASDIAEIWELVDLRHDNKLNKDQLAVAVHLIYRRLEGHEFPPMELPNSLIPPSMRSRPQTHIRRASVPSQPRKKAPPPPPPASKKPSISLPASPLLRRTSSFSPLASTSLRPPKPIESELKNRFSIAVIPEGSPASSFPPANIGSPGPFTSYYGNVTTPPAFSNHHYNDLRVPTIPASPSPHSPSPSSPAVHPDHEMMTELRAETKHLRNQVGELLTQLKENNQYRERNEVIKEDNKRLKNRLQEMETAMSQLVQANEGADRTEELSHEVARLTRLLGDHQETEAELRDTLNSVAELTQQNRALEQNYADLKTEKESVEEKLKEKEDKMQDLQVEKNSIATRLIEMEKLLADPQTKGSSKRELQMLLKDVTKENDMLKNRERHMHQQMSTILLTSRNQAEADDMKRENTRLKSEVEELEEVMKRMQATSSDNQLQRRINELEREKGALDRQVTEVARRVREIEEVSERKIAELQRRCQELQANNQTPRHMHNSSVQREDNAPPPAYSEVSMPT
ncbi:hypothetical protein AGABI1DRAFT_77389 [Agaricus bisporus var. burnettii JB137-S8]|uniref:Uncharacterized protein n=1 Tax=Agaricus bisporus var. burnettii (strain JB137-S8 / ATCC MYA-4627 / FGSC 10392) TaxID=597362 RepID=K5WPT4_AGABU|nr:uncharacterized protein AGABI1DRAFT_77389 [Agaricus bisporus var. burnettii JB137-S8]EKM77366.1 hypothetical protein AGABI1DRAFT_77389 [Agaricus bisporus var. burnettii JB137-S8]